MKKADAKGQLGRRFGCFTAARETAAREEFGMRLTAGETEVLLRGCWGGRIKWKNYLGFGHKDKLKVS